MKTSTILVKAIKNESDYKLTYPVFVDYFGLTNIGKDVREGKRAKITEKDFDKINGTIQGIYKDLILYKGVTEKLLEKCFWTNRLDELIHTKYKHHKSAYYKDFCKMNIKLGPTPLLGQYDPETNDKLYDYEYFDILDDNHCPNCLCEGYITEQNCNFGPVDCGSGPVDCVKCGIILCKLCSSRGKDQHFYCWGCFPCGTLEENIQRKISTYQAFDRQKFKLTGNIAVKDVIELLGKQNSRCWVCGDIVLVLKFKPYCCYQFSIDRIDNTKPHDKDNCLISCYYCNCRHHENFNQPNKVCSQNCHNIKRNIIKRSEKLSQLLKS